MENIRNYETNCKINLMEFYHFQNYNQRNQYEYKANS